MDDVLTRSSINYSLTERERRIVSILIVESDTHLRSTMRQALVSIGYGDIADASDAAAAMAKLDEREFTHLIFDTKEVNIPATDFLAMLLNKHENLIVIPASADPTVDEVFDLLIGGARGYLAKPCTAGTLEESIVWATKGESISDAVRKASTRNEALAMLALSALDKLAVVMKQARSFDTAKREVPRKWAILNRAVDIGRTFCKGGDPHLRQSIVSAALKSAEVNLSQRAPGLKRRSRRRSSRATNPDVDVSTVK